MYCFLSKKILHVCSLISEFSKGVVASKQVNKIKHSLNDIKMHSLEFSDGGSEASLEDVRQHHGIIKTQKQDDPDYLTLFEAHQRRLEDGGSQAPGQGY